ncbi:hypothetical protein [Arthrobacter sp. NA-172]|uniref:hypothetical protein n=1 Tax=Arthrobacter sp. NA-172 TaxID=3367524 RepID=UPI0037551C47
MLNKLDDQELRRWHTSRAVKHGWSVAVPGASDHHQTPLPHGRGPEQPRGPSPRSWTRRRSSLRWDGLRPRPSQ